MQKWLIRKLGEELRKFRKNLNFDKNFKFFKDIWHIAHNQQIGITGIGAAHGPIWVLGSLRAVHLLSQPVQLLLLLLLV